MNRRTFFKSCGGAIAALMLPFGVKVEAVVIAEHWIHTPWYSLRVNDAFLHCLKPVIKRTEEGLKITPPLDLEEE